MIAPTPRTPDSKPSIEPEINPKVSVVIPTYNRGKYLGDAVRSVLAQSFIDFEVIVIDDGSTDDTDAVIKEIHDNRLIYERQANRGRSNARNHALRIARGAYITFLDSDDLYLPDKLQLQVSYLDNHPSVGMIYTSALCINDLGVALSHSYEATVSGHIYNEIAFFTPVTITLPTVMVRREVFDRVGGFDEQMHRFEDTDMWRRIAKYYWIEAIPEYTCALRTHGDNSLAAQDPDYIKIALNYYASKIIREDCEFSMLLRRKGLAGIYMYYGQALQTVPIWRGKGRALLFTSFRYWPFLLSKAFLIRFIISPLRQAARSVFFRTLNHAYRYYSKLKRFILNLSK